METPTSTPEMADPMKMVKVSEKNFDRLKHYGCAGESLNTALGRVLDLAEKIEKEMKK